VLAFIGVAAIIVAVVVAGAMLLVVPFVFPEQGWAMSLPIAVGSALYVGVATLTGMLYGLRRWSVLAVVIVVDVALRLVFTLIVFALGGDIVALAWATIVPFPLLGALLAVLVFGRSHPGYRLDVTAKPLVKHTLGTVAAGIGVAVLVSGFPLFVGLAAHDTPDQVVGSLIFALVITRAPLVVVMLALQSYLVVILRDRQHIYLTILKLSALLAAAGAVLAVLVYFWGEPVLVFFAGPDFSVEPLLLALLVIGSIFTGLLALSGAATLARRRHRDYVLGWTVAAGLAVALLFLLPADLATRVVVALTVGPLVGYLLHLIGLRRHRDAREPAQDQHA
jgi:O-antigen/teichoic acid export membrane protein